MRLRLVEPAHDAETDVHASFFHKRRNDGVEGAFARRQHVGRGGVENEAGAAVLQVESEIVHDDAGTEARGKALYERADVTVCVHCTHINSLFAEVRRIARLPITVRVVGVNRRGALGPVVFGNDAAIGDLGEARIGVVAAQVGVGELLRLHFDVPGARICEAPFAERKFLHDVEHFERRHPLAVRRQLVNRPAAISGRNRLDPFGLKLREIIGGHHAAQPVRSLENGPRDLALVKGVAALGGDALERATVFRVAPDFTDVRRPSVYQK